MIAHERLGQGEPIVLLHGLGSDREVWRPVRDRLAGELEVLPVDLPGFGESVPLAQPAVPTPRALAGAVAELLDELGIDRAHLAGNSLGGWVAVELARMGRARSLTLLSPAGLWRHSTPTGARVALLASRTLAQRLNRWVPALLGNPVGRTLLLWHVIGRPWRMSTDEAVSMSRSMADCPGFHPTFQALRHQRITDARDLGVPITVAFGARDFLLLAHQARLTDELPEGVTIRTIPGCGHVPTFDNPPLIAELILAGTRRAQSTDR
ncbi:MAG TPA: alpha/beta fold hydrolase [Mycobacteriales bacterium]